MFRNLLTTLSRFRTASILNILGLATAYVTFIIIALQVATEYSHDTMYPDGNRIYRVETNATTYSDVWDGNMPRPLVEKLETFSPDIEAYSYRDFSWDIFINNWYVGGKNAGNSLIKWNATYAKPDFTDFFGFEFSQGGAMGTNPDEVIVPKSFADKYFTDGIAVGKTLENQSDIVGIKTIVGVYEDLPSNSMFTNDIYLNIGNRDIDAMNNNNYRPFIRLRKGADVAAVERAIAENLTKSDKGSHREKLGMQYRITKISECYYRADNYNPQFKPDKMRLFTIIAILILVIAAINYINFATALVPLRIRGINARKIFGATNAKLRLGLVFEAIAISLIGFAIAYLVISGFETLDGISFTPTSVVVGHSGHYIGLVGVIAVVIGLLAGLYPAFYATSFRAAYVLKGTFSLSPQGRTLRAVLVGFQFVISTGLIIVALFMNLQFSMIRNADLGIEKENVLRIRVEGKVGSSIEAFRNELSRIGGVKQSAYSLKDIITDEYQVTDIQFKDSTITLDNIVVSSDFDKLFGMKVVEGRGFISEDDEKPHQSVVVINRSAQKRYGIGVGDYLGGNKSSSYSINIAKISNEREVVGIIEDFNFKPLYSQVEPFAMMNLGGVELPGSFETPLYVKTQTSDYKTLIDNIIKAGKGIDPDWAADVTFLDEKIEELYRDDLRSSEIIRWFSLLAILISLTGVFGLVHFEVGYRRKEIGLRKINGATVGEILIMFGRKYVIMVAVCYLIALPMAVYAVSKWLESFAYRTPLHRWVFAVSLLMVLTITIVTVVVQSYRSATENPVNAIKCE